ncbi:AzlC family ABC transporter permease [soil metagenome]
MNGRLTPPARASLAMGVKDIAPALLGILPFGLVSGVAAVSVGIPALPAFAMSFVVFAGASQIAAAQLIGLSAPVAVIWLGTLMINLRMMMYSATLAPHVRTLPQTWRAFVAYLLTDQAFAFSLLRFQKDEPPDRRLYYVGVAAPSWLVWVLSSAVGVFAGAQLPASLALGFTVPLIFMAMVFPNVTDRPTAAAALVGGLVAVLAYTLPNNLGLVLGAFAGIGAGLLLEARAA